MKLDLIFMLDFSIDCSEATSDLTSVSVNSRNAPAQPSSQEAKLILSFYSVILIDSF